MNKSCFNGAESKIEFYGMKSLSKNKRNHHLFSVEWVDLLKLNRVEKVYELLISLPWLGFSLLFAAAEYFFVALFFSFIFFLTGLRQNHNACHYAMGLSKKGHQWVLFILSVLMLGSMHAVQINHLRHHQYFPDKEDLEAMSAHQPAFIAFLIGPFFPILLHIKAVRVANNDQLRWIIAELLANAIWIMLVFYVFDLDYFKYHVCAMAIGQCLTAFFAVWTVHHDCDPEHHVARTVRNPIVAKVTFNMFFHMEHHLFPAVPTCHLHILARRIDQSCPDLPKKSVFVQK